MVEDRELSQGAEPGEPGVAGLQGARASASPENR